MSTRETEIKFYSIVAGQLPAGKERVKKALDNPDVGWGFRELDNKSRDFLDFLGAVASEHLIFPDEMVEISNRLNGRKTFAING